MNSSDLSPRSFYRSMFRLAAGVAAFGVMGLAPLFASGLSPIVTSVSPAAIPLAGNTIVTVNGTFFTGATYVTVGGSNVPASSFTANSDTSISFPAPADSTNESVDVTVTTPFGTSEVGAADQILYEDGPIITGVSPLGAAEDGSTLVTVSGANFTDASMVIIGEQNLPSSSFTLNGSSTITFYAPVVAQGGVVDVTVVTPVGSSSLGLSDNLTYETAPTVSGVSPSSAFTDGSTALTITGTNFTGASQVTIGGQNLPSSSFTVNGSTTIYVNAPSSATTGLVDVTVTTPAGSSSTSSADQVTYVAVPTVTGVSPIAASTLGGTTLTITGTNFDGATRVSIGGQNLPSSSFTVNSSTTITVPSSPAENAGLVDITVTNPAGTSATSSSDQITIEGAPIVTAVTPVAILQGINNTLARPGAIHADQADPTVQVTGTNFTGATRVTVGGLTAPIRSRTATTLQINPPLHTPGSYDVQVVTPVATSSTSSADLLTYEGVPTVTGVSVTQGPIAGGTSLTLTGSGFIGASSVSFGANNPTTSLTVNSSTTIFLTSPAGSPGLVDITVTTPVGTSSTSSADHFTYLNPTPAINDQSLTSGTVNQALTFQVNATNNATVYTATNLPPGLTINSASGLISGTPTSSGAYYATTTAANASGTAVSGLTFNIAGAAQTVTFPGNGGTLNVGANVTLLATASSGLPVTYKIVSGTATLTTGASGTTVSTNVANQSVVIEADQTGNGTYSAASARITLSTAAAATQLVYTGSLTIQGSATNLRQPAASASTIAATVNATQTSGTLLGYIPTLNAGFVANFTIGAGGAFSVSTPSLVASPAVSQTLTITGTVSGTTVSGSISPVGVTFSLGADPSTGPSSTVSGFYTGSTLQSSAGGTYSIVGTQNDVIVLAISPTLVSAGTGTLSNNNFTVAGSSSATITGTLNPANTSISGSVSTPTTGTTTYSGVVATTTPAVRLVNLSTRGSVTPTSPLTAGFVIGGTTTKTVLLRGVGPSLASFGLSGVLAHPTLTLMTGTGTVLATNTGWAGASALSTLAASAGAFPLPANSADSALVSSLAPGSYTVQISDAAADAGGLALVEIYDTTVDLSGTTQKLLEVSTIGAVGSGANVMVAGFVVSGNTPKEVMVRGVGPTLGAFGITAAIADPVLVVYDTTGAVVAQNNDWSTAIQVGTTQVTATAAQLVAAASQVGAFALNAGSKDASLLVTLAPGAYTAQVSSGTGAAGICLVEIYEVSP